MGSQWLDLSTGAMFWTCCDDSFTRRERPPSVWTSYVKQHSGVNCFHRTSSKCQKTVAFQWSSSCLFLVHFKIINLFQLSFRDYASPPPPSQNSKQRNKKHMHTYSTGYCSKWLNIVISFFLFFFSFWSPSSYANVAFAIETYLLTVNTLQWSVPHARSEDTEVLVAAV